MGFLDEIRSTLDGENNVKTSADKKAAVIFGYCPGCTEKLAVEKGKTVTCPVCGRVSSVEDLTVTKTGGKTVVSQQNAVVAQAVSNITGVEDAIVYLKNFFVNFDWASYNEQEKVLIYDVEDMVTNLKIRKGSNALVWKLDYDSVAIPLAKKVLWFAETEKKMADLYSDVDQTDMMEVFDVYKANVNEIVRCKDTLLRRLSSAISNAEEMKISAAELEAMKEDFSKVEALVAGLKEVKEVEEVPAVQEAIEKFNKQKEEEFAKKGIDAQRVYREAITFYETGRGAWHKALDLFITIKGYKDVNKYISKIDKYYVFNKEVVFISGKPFVLQTKVIEEIAIDVKGKKKTDDEDEFNGATFELFEIEDKEPKKDPVINGITSLITVYATKLFYIKKNKELCYYNSETGEERVIDTFKKSNKYDTDKLWFSAGGDVLYIRKQLALDKEKLGCFKRLFKKAEYIKHINNYSLVAVNLSLGTVDELVPELVDVYQFNQKEGNIFYTYAEEVASKKEKLSDTEEKENETIKKLFVINLETKFAKEVLNDNCDIKKVDGTKVIYTYHTPNEYNQDLRVYDMADESDILIEANIYNFVDVIRGKLYYQVGNADYSPLFSITYSGTDRVQIMDNVGNIITVRGGWIYVVWGFGVNRVLRKISYDGKKIISLCSSYEKILKITRSHIFYVNCYDELCSVRADGEEETIIASDIDPENIIVDTHAFYYLRRELVDRKKFAYSLYTMDGEGKNVRKLAFNVVRMQNYDDEKLYISQRDIGEFEVTIPEAKGKAHTIHVTNNLSKTIEYNKNTGKFEIVRIVGLPSKDEYEFKKGCFRGKETVKASYIQVPSKPTYFREQKETGAVYEQQLEEINMEGAKQLDKNSGCTGNGCGDGCGKGCSGK